MAVEKLKSLVPKPDGRLSMKSFAFASTHAASIWSFEGSILTVLPYFGHFLSDGDISRPNPWYKHYQEQLVSLLPSRLFCLKIKTIFSQGAKHSGIMVRPCELLTLTKKELTSSICNIFSDCSIEKNWFLLNESNLLSWRSFILDG